MKLEQWVVVGKVVYGKIYGDIRGKWKDGHDIRTTAVQSSLKDLKEGSKITTKNSAYLLGKPLIIQPAQQTDRSDSCR